jgi:hypothetical protein
MQPITIQPPTAPTAPTTVNVGPDAIVQVIIPALIAGGGWFGRQWWESKHRREQARIEAEKAQRDLTSRQESGEFELIKTLIDAQTKANESQTATNRELIAAQQENVREMRGLKDAVHELATATTVRCDRLEQRFEVIEHHFRSVSNISPPQRIAAPPDAWPDAYSAYSAQQSQPRQVQP